MCNAAIYACRYHFDDEILEILLTHFITKHSNYYTMKTIYAIGEPMMLHLIGKIEEITDFKKIKMLLNLLVKYKTDLAEEKLVDYLNAKNSQLVNLAAADLAYRGFYYEHSHGTQEKLRVAIFNLTDKIKFLLAFRNSVKIIKLILEIDSEILSLRLVFFKFNCGIFS